MKDEAITVDVGMTPAEDAVAYLLKRMRLDANLAYHMRGTEAFARLVRAEAARTGKSEEGIEQTYSQLTRGAEASIPIFREVRDEIVALLDELPGTASYGDTQDCLLKIRKQLQKARSL